MGPEAKRGREGVAARTDNPSGVDGVPAIRTTLPPPVLEAVRDEFDRMARERTGPRGELKRAWFNYTKQALEDARLRDRQDTFGMYSELR